MNKYYYRFLLILSLILLSSCAAFWNKEIRTSKNESTKINIQNLDLVFISTLNGLKDTLTLIDKFYLTFTVLVCFLGQIFIGKKIQMYLGAYGDYTFVMLFTLFYLYRFYWETKSPYQFIKSEITLN